MLLHIDNGGESGPRSAPFPQEVSEQLRETQAVHDSLPRPEQAGRYISL